MIFYAKTNPIETIREHTDNVLSEYSSLKAIYENDINEIVTKFMKSDYFWNILNMCCEYHDYGKCNLQFQNKLRSKLSEVAETEEEKEKFRLIPCEENEEIPHNYLSPAFLPKNKLKEIRMKEHMLGSQEFAEKLGVPRSTYSQWENGISNPTLIKAIEIAVKFNKKVEEIWYF